MSALEVDHQTSEIAKLPRPPAKAAPEKTRFYRKLYVQVLIAVALGAILLPWLLYPSFGDSTKALEFGKIWEGLWPVLIGVGLALGLKGLGWPLPRVPAGDSIVFFEAAFRRILALGPAFESFDARLRQWPAAGVSLLLIVLALFAATVLG